MSIWKDDLDEYNYAGTAACADFEIVIQRKDFFTEGAQENKKPTT